MAAELDRDGRDEDALHLVAVRGNEVVGTCRLLMAAEVARLGRLVVASDQRRQGIGRGAGGRRVRQRRRCRCPAGRPQRADPRHRRVRVAGLHRPWRAVSGGRDRSTCGWSATLPEVRIDPISGRKTIVAGDRATRPGRRPARRSAGAAGPRHRPLRRRPRGPHAARAVGLRPGGGPPDSPGWTVRVVPNLYPALDPASPEPPRVAAARPVLRRARHRGARGDRQRARAGDLAVAAAGRAGGQRDGGLARADARARRRGLRAPDRQRAPRGGRLAAPHPRTAVRAGVRARRRRARARALRRLRDAHGAPTCWGTWWRRRSSCASGWWRSTTRRCCWRPTASRLPFQLMVAPRRPRDALRGRGAVRGRAAARGPQPPGAAPGGGAAAEPVGAHRAARGRALLLAHRHRPPPGAHRRAGARGWPVPQRRCAGEPRSELREC